MKPSIQTKLEQLESRFEELQALMSSPEVIDDNSRFRACSQEYAELEPVVEAWRAYQRVQADLAEAEALLDDPDPDMREMGQEEVRHARARLEEMEANLNFLLLPKDPNDSANVYLEIRAGTGGDEAALFAGDLYRMYVRYGEQKGWRFEVMSENPGEHGGYKEIIVRVEGQNVYRQLKFESGAHRVQRVPETESQGRIHTSACTVAVLPEVEEVDAIRITHLPTGTVVECQDERSQHKNRARAMSLLQAKLLSQVQEAQRKEQAQTRKSLVGSGDRSERIRTYNFPQGRVTDHRINLTLYKLDEILQGDLDPVIEPLLQEYQAEQLAQLQDA